MNAGAARRFRTWASAAIAAALVLSGCAGPSTRASAYRKGVDDGYVLGAADEVKRLYWARQDMEADSNRRAGRVEYYTWEDPGNRTDGLKLAPATVAVPVFVPSPVEAEGR